MVYLTIYSISALMAYFGIQAFQLRIQDFINNQIFTNKDKGRMFDLCLLFHSHGGLLVAIPIVNTLVGIVTLFVVALDVYWNGN